MNRILNTGDILIFGNKKESFVIEKVIGKGASSVTYLAKCDKTEHILKECNPFGIKMHRQENGYLVPDTALSEKKFNECRERFLEGAKKQLTFRLTDNLKNVTSNIQNIYYANNTIYVDMTFFNGDTLDKIADNSLYELLIRMRALTKVIGHYHNLGYLHLDIKPQNIYTIPETADLVMMFDFDSVIQEVMIEKKSGLSYTDDWAAPEQKMQKYRKKISKATDIYAIGEILFYRIMERHSEMDDRFDFSEYEYDRNSVLLEDVNPKIFTLLNELFHKTICCQAEKRYQTVDELLLWFEKAIYVAAPQTTYLINRVPNRKDFFVGRKGELLRIQKELEKNSVLFLYGMGGIGKSELVKQYIKEYEKEYDNIIFAPYVSDMETLFCDDEIVSISHFERLQNECIDEYYKRKMKEFKSLIYSNENRILFVIDNLTDIEDKQFHEILSLGCKIIVTSRISGIEYGFNSIKIDYLSDFGEVRSLFYYYYLKEITEKEREDIDKIIELVEKHTLAVELLAKQMMASRISPRQMLVTLQEKGFSDSGKEKIVLNKDKVITKSSAYEHIKKIFDISFLSDGEIYVLRNLSFLPYSGICTNIFFSWCELETYDDINSLVLNGWITKDSEKDYIALHPLIAEIVKDTIDTDAKCIELLLQNSKKEFDDGNICEVQKDWLVQADILYYISKQLILGEYSSLIIAEYLENISFLLKIIGYSNTGKMAKEKALDIYIKELGKNNKKVVEMYFDMSKEVKILNDDLAEEYSNKAESILEKYNEDELKDFDVGRLGDMLLEELEVMSVALCREEKEIGQINNIDDAKFVYNKCSAIIKMSRECDGKIKKKMLLSIEESLWKVLHIYEDAYGKNAKGILGEIYFNLSNFYLLKKDSLHLAQKYGEKSLEIYMECEEEERNQDIIYQLKMTLDEIYEKQKKIKNTKEALDRAINCFDEKEIGTYLLLLNDFFEICNWCGKLKLWEEYAIKLKKLIKKNDKSFFSKQIVLGSLRISLLCEKFINKYL